jgi:putative ABC transport system permease protein
VSLWHRLAGRFPSFVIARRNVSRARTRSILAAVAILIGVVAIGAIGAGGAAFKQSQLDRIQDQGATNVFVSPGFDAEARHFDREDILAIEETVGSAGIVATQDTSMNLVTRDGRDFVSATYIEDPRQVARVQTGEIPTNWRRQIVVSDGFAAEHQVTVGDRVSLVHVGTNETGEPEPYRIAAVLAETQGFGTSDVYLPLARADERTYGQVRVTTQSVTAAEDAATRLRERFNDRKDRLLVFELTSLVRLFRTIVTGINAFLAGLGSLSLLIAGVAIANTMLMAVIKRREEIGVLRAVGYTKADVVRLLLVEAALLGTIGAAIGGVIATLVALVANAIFLGDPLAFTGTAVAYLVAAMGVGVVTSVIAGIYPAWRAANERPVEALRG